MTIDIKRLNSRSQDFRQQLQDLLAWEAVSDEAVLNSVSDIINAVKTDGDRALIELTAKFDNLRVDSISQLEMPLSRLADACEGLAEPERNALEQAAARIRSYAGHQKMESWQYTESDGTVLGQQITALDRAGLYVPGGKAAYPSSVLMNAIPAKVAGVEELIMVVPTPDGVVNELVLAAAHIGWHTAPRRFRRWIK
jgi:histidinol dehydrogenase